MNKNFNLKRSKTNFKTYKEACEALKEKVYKRGSEEKEEQLKRWETDHNLYKQKDNSFTHINKDFKNKKQIQKEEVKEKGTVIVGNHSVFLGGGKYSLDKFSNMRKVFFNVIENSDAKTKTEYINDFYSTCYMFNVIYEEDFKQELKASKSKSTAYDIFYNECKYVFNYYLKNLKDEIVEFVNYYDDDNEIINFCACESAWKEAIEELGFNYFDFKTRIQELYDKVDEILLDNDFNPINRKETKYFLSNENNYTYNDEDILCVTDVTKLYEIIKLVVIRKIKKQSVALGMPTKSYKLTPEEFKEAKEFIEEYVCYFDEYSKQKYYSVEDIPKTVFEQVAV